LSDRWNPKKQEDKEDWLMSYADMLTLLLAFFVLLLSMSHIDAVKYAQVEGGMAKDIGKRDGDPPPLQKLQADMGELLKGMKVDDTQIALGTDDRGLVLELDGSSFFEPGSAKLKEAQLPNLIKMSELLTSSRYNAFQVEIQGHTDDTPVSTQEFPSNWELSAARASAVVRLFISKGMNPTRLAAEGFADTHPKVANRDANGNPLPVNQGINRRVTIHVFPR
jgi:chemotaxis protein MotB